MEANDMYLKVVFTAYFPVNGLEIEKREFPNNPDANGIYYNNMLVIPDIRYQVVAPHEDAVILEDLPEDMQLEPDFTTHSEEFVTGEQIATEEPSYEFFKDVIESWQAENSEDQEK